MHNRPDGFDIYLVNVKTIRTIAHIFVVFSEKLNFTTTSSNLYLCMGHFHKLASVLFLFFLHAAGYDNGLRGDSAEETMIVSFIFF